MISLCLFVCFAMQDEENERSEIPGKLMIASTHLSYTLSTQLQKLLIRFEHIRLLHAGPSLFLASLSRHFHLVRGHSLIRSITRSAITSAARCQRNHLILLISRHCMGLHPRTCSSLWRTMGGGKSMKKHLSLVVGNARLIETIAGNDGLVRV